MAHGYRTLQHWNQWLHKDHLGGAITQEEKSVFAKITDKHYGKHAVLLGVPNQFELLEAAKIPCHSLISPFMSHERQPGFIEGDFHQLPLLSGSVDLVLVPHTFEYVDNPRALINEACRIVKPEGLIVVMGFNPYSFWGMRKLFSAKNTRVNELAANYLNSGEIKNWLKLAEFQVEYEDTSLIRPPLGSKSFFDKLAFIEKVGKMIPFCGGIYYIVARAKVIPITPIRMKWKQRLGNIRISTTIPGNIAGSLNKE